VTHDARYARDAQRTIHLFDGRLVENVALDQAPECCISAS